MTAPSRSPLRAVNSRALNSRMLLPLTLLAGTARLRFAARVRYLATRRARTARLRVLLGLHAGERILATARDPAASAPDGEPLAAHSLVLSDRALYYRRDGEWSRLGWERIVRAGWDPAGRLVFDAALSGTGRSRVSVPVHPKGNVPEIALERIGHTRLGERRAVLPGGARIRVEARRRPGTGELAWLVIPDAATPAPGLSDEELRRRAAPVLAHLSTEFGIPGHPAAGLAIPAPPPPEASVSVPRPRAAADGRQPVVPSRQPFLRTRG